MSSGKSGDGNEDESQIDDSQLKLAMESIQEQFRSYNSFLQDMRKDLKEIKAARCSNTARARPSTTSTRIQTLEGEEVDNPNHYFRNLNNKSGREHNNGNPLVLPSGPITRSRAKKYGATMSLYIQEQVTQELHDLALNKCCVELQDRPKILTLIEAYFEENKKHARASWHTQTALESDLRKESNNMKHAHSTMELKGAWVPQLLTKIRGRIFSRKGGMIRIRYHSTIELKEAWGASKFLTLMEAHVEMEYEIPAYGIPWPY
ncbi:hypothetical protein JCGZ_17480 [Jatropha curcas]|uniref:Uncharacterized protein n=1 Tax=Jatropha curcas TaxID=180498 RepID=A0A067LD44_JATCU|nr:hypothetical protein JCGZ_17480 [Jatropha curcas]